MNIQFSPIRSGSTLIYNYLKELNKNPYKIHYYTYNKNNKYIITIRHPYNSIISKLNIFNEEITETSLKNNYRIHK